MKFKTTHYYIAPVYTDDENTYEPTHCSIEIHPLILWAIFKYLLTAWLIEKINGEIDNVRFRFNDVLWHNIMDSDAEIDEGTITNESLSAFDDMFNLEGYQLEILPGGYFRLHCYDEHGPYFYSEEIRYADLLRWEYFSWT